MACQRVQLQMATRQMSEAQMFCKYRGREKKKNLYSAAPPSLYKHSKVKSTRGLLNDQSCVMKFSLQNPQVLEVSGRDKRPGRKSNLFHRVIIFHLLQLLPKLGGKNGKLGLSPPNAARALCPLAPLLSLAASQGWELAQLQGWHPAHWFREGKARGSGTHQQAERKMHRGVILSSGKKAGGPL